MASAAQIQANRLNAQKSTGPRTAVGKERASQNALKHGLLAREAVIQGEDLEEFELYREGMLEELAPVGAVEAMLAQRVVSLSWRLRRAERLQNAAFAALDEGEPTPLLEARHEEWKQLKGNEWERGLAGLFDEDAALGKVVVEDFGGARVLDRLLMYERRIESSLYRTMAELRRERQARTAAAEPEEGSRSEGGLAAGQEPAAPAELASFGATAATGGRTSMGASEGVSRSEDPLPTEQEFVTPAKLGSFGADGVPEGGAEEVSSGRGQVSGDGSDLGSPRQNSALGSPFTLQTSPLSLAKITPYGVTTNVRDAGNHGQDAHATGIAARIEPSCETNPIRRSSF